MRLATVVFVGLLVMSVAPGCIEFERQTILLKLDRENDVLKARLIYQGIYSGGGSDKAFVEDMGELEDVAKGGTRFFLFDNWPMEVDLARPKKGETDKPAVAMMRRQTTLTNGTFFLDDEGKLSAWQDIEIKDVSKLLTNANRLLNLAILTGQADVLEDADDRSKELCRSLALAGHEWIRLDEKGLRFVFAASHEGAAKLKRSLLDDLVKQARKKKGEPDGGAAATPPTEEPEEKAKPAEKEDGEIDQLEVVIRYIARNNFSWIHRGHECTLGLAPDEKGRIRLNCWNKGRYVPNLRNAGNLPATIDETVKLEKLMDL